MQHWVTWTLNGKYTPRYSQQQKQDSICGTDKHLAHNTLPRSQLQHLIKHSNGPGSTSIPTSANPHLEKSITFALKLWACCNSSALVTTSAGVLPCIYPLISLWQTQSSPAWTEQAFKMCAAISPGFCGRMALVKDRCVLTSPVKLELAWAEPLGYWWQHGAPDCKFLWVQAGPFLPGCGHLCTDKQ